MSVEIARDAQETTRQQVARDVVPQVEPQVSEQDSHAADAEQDSETEFADWRPPASPAEARERAAAFFEENAYREGVMSLPSGLQYKVLKNGSGDVPGPTDTVVVQYRGTLLDGREFGSSDAADGPEQFRVDEVMPGWQEALQRMREGAVWELYVPPRLAHTKGTRNRGTLGFQPLIYQVELVAIAEPQPDEEQSGKATVTSD